MTREHLSAILAQSAAINADRAKRAEIARLNALIPSPCEKAIHEFEQPSIHELPDLSGISLDLKAGADEPQKQESMFPVNRPFFWLTRKDIKRGWHEESCWRSIENENMWRFASGHFGDGSQLADYLPEA